MHWEGFSKQQFLNSSSDKRHTTMEGIVTRCHIVSNTKETPPNQNKAPNQTKPNQKPTPPQAHSSFFSAALSLHTFVLTCPHSSLCTESPNCDCIKHQIYVLMWQRGNGHPVLQHLREVREQLFGGVDSFFYFVLRQGLVISATELPNQASGQFSCLHLLSVEVLGIQVHALHLAFYVGSKGGIQVVFTH